MFKTLSHTASTMIVSEGKVLLHMHAKFHTWLQVGGHMEANELPHDTALREAREEAGVDVTFFNPKQRLVFPQLQTVISPMHVRLIDTNQGWQFLDFLYYATIPSCISICQMESEFQWFTATELQNHTIIKPDVCYFGLEAIELLTVK